ncbi:MAG: CopG family ribbon-helix-helix protein [Thermomicrobiales bacterium]
MDKTTIYIPHDINVAVKSIARRTGRSQAVVIREALAAYVAQDNQQEQPWPTSIGMADNDTFRGADDEELLRQRWKRDW